MVKDERTLAYINMFAVLGSLENLCVLDKEAADIIKDQEKIVVLFTVKDGPSAAFTFEKGTCKMEEGQHPCDIKLGFSSCSKFNGLIDGTVTPIPSKGFTKIGFLTKKFTKLTDIMSKYLKAEAESLKDKAFFNISTDMMLYVISGAISQIANNDKIGKFSASNTPDGIARLSIKGAAAASLVVKDHIMHTVKEPLEGMRAYMEFDSRETARNLFDGRVNSFACIGNGNIRIGGMISMIDNINRILDRVAVYLQ